MPTAVASQTVVEAAKLSAEVAHCGCALTAVRGKKSEPGNEGKSSIENTKAQHHAINTSLFGFSAACSAFGKDGAGALNGWASWAAAAKREVSEMKTLAADVLQQHASDLQSAVSKFSPGGKSKSLGGSWKAGLPEDSSWQDVIREMESCFWSKPQALADVQEGTTRLKTVLQSYV